MAAPGKQCFGIGAGQREAPREEFVDEVVRSYARNCEAFIHWGRPLEATFFKEADLLESYLLTFFPFRGWIK